MLYMVNQYYNDEHHCDVIELDKEPTHDQLKEFYDCDEVCFEPYTYTKATIVDGKIIE
jgi:hypothetical protein